MSDSLPAAEGYVRVGDYASFTLFKGPAGAAPALQLALKAAGFESRVADDLATVHLVDHDIDADSGIPTSPYVTGDPPPLDLAPNAVGLYVIALDGYVEPDWLLDLAARGIVLVEPLPPNAYIARLSPSLAATLTTAAPYVRSTFRLTPAMKLADAHDQPTETAAAYRPYEIETYEDAKTPSLQPLLDSLDENGRTVLLTRLGKKVHYSVNLADSDVIGLALSEQVFGIAPVGTPVLSSERQANLVAQPVLSGSRLTLPTSASSYSAFLVGKCYSGQCITDFSNTHIAMIDTGFDNGITGSGIQPDFASGQVNTQYGSTIFSQVWDSSTSNYVITDDATHGTMTSSMVGGFMPYGTRSDCGGYRYALGLAPQALIAMDKFTWSAGRYEWSCGNPPVLSTTLNMACVLADALTKFSSSGWNPNIVNHSWNDSTCTYTSQSQALDLDTRTASRLHVVSAGNTSEATCVNARGPGTARNAISVGATYDFAPSCASWPNFFGGQVGLAYADTCPWDFIPSTQDGRNIASFSGKGKGAGYPIKPDLVAPAVVAPGPVSRQLLPSPCAQIPANAYGQGTVFCDTPLDSTTYCTTGRAQYGLSAGTSFAAPVVTGAAAVVRKWYRLITATDPTPAMTKAALIAGARDIAGGTVWAPNSSTNPTGLVSVGTVGHVPDVWQGWGMVSFDKLLGPASSYFLLDQNTSTRLMTPNEVLGWTVTIVDGTKDSRVVLTWTDPYKTTTAQKGTVYASLVNNLDLEAYIGLGDPWFWGNNFDGNGHSTPNPSPVVFDTINSVEELVFPANTYGTGTAITIYVEANGLMGDALHPDTGTIPEQDFALFGYNLH